MIVVALIAVAIAVYAFLRSRGRVLPAPAEFPAHFAKVHGILQKSADGASYQDVIRKCRVGEELRFVREPDNPKDRFAIKICRLNGEQLGYWRGYDDVMAHDLDCGNHYKVFIQGFYGFTTEGGRRGRGVRIRFQFMKEDGGGA